MNAKATDPSAQRILEIKQLLTDLLARLPAHSVPPAMIVQIESLEEELAQLESAADRKGP